MHQGGHGQEVEPGEVSGDEAGVAGVVSQTQTAMAEAGAKATPVKIRVRKRSTCTDWQSAAVGDQVRPFFSPK